MQKLVLVGQDQRRIKIIKDEIRELCKERPELRVQALRPGFLETSIDKSLQFILFDTRVVNKGIFPIVVQIRKLGFTGPILVVGQPGSKFDIAEFNAVKNLFHLAPPYEKEQLVGFIKNCLNVDMLRKRKDQRFAVNEFATLECYASDFRAETTINDISKGGVRIQGNLEGLRKGDLLKLHVNFDKIKSERVMSARVVWLKKESDKNEQAGLEFVSQKTVYKYLLDYAAA